MASLLLKQQEKLRRVVDDWRHRTRDLLSELHGDPSASFSAYSSARSDPIRLHVEPIEHSDLASLLESDNVAVSKFLTVLSHDCVEINRLSQFASRNLYRQLVLFGHRSGPQGVLLEGEPQKDFGRLICLFIELYETVNEMTAVLGNLLQQLNAVYSLHDKNVRPLNSFKNVTCRTAFESFGNGLSMFLVLDEILKENGNIKSYLSLYARMMSKVKSEVDTFSMSLEDLDFLDHVVGNLLKHFGSGFFQRLVQMESPWHASLNLVRCNKKLLDAFSSSFHDRVYEILPRLDTWKELPLDRRKMLNFLALYLFFTHASAETPDKKLGKLLLEMFHSVPIIYVGGKGIILFDVVKSQCPPALSSWPPMREACKDIGVTKSNYLTRLNEIHSRDWQAIKDALSCWAVTFHSVFHPSLEMLKEECIRLLLKQIFQGIGLADKLQTLLHSMLDIHALLEVPIRREKVNSLCHMVISLKVIGEMFQSKWPSIIQSLPHIVSLIQADVEQLILPFKDKLQQEITKWSQASKVGFWSSLTRGGKEMDTRMIDSLSVVLVSLQLLEGNGSSKRQLVFSIAMDVLQSIAHLDIDFLRIRKSISKMSIVSDFQNIIEEKTNCSFLYWRKEMIGTWLSMVYVDDRKYSWLQYILDAFFDGLWLLKLGNVGRSTLQTYEEEIENALKNEIIAPLCRDIETDLRLHVHSIHLKGSVAINPTKTGVRNLSWYLWIRPLRLPSKLINVKLLVESYLHYLFYGHSAISTFDGKIYSEMRRLGKLKYGLELDDFNHAEYIVDQGFGIKKIVENLDEFAEKYSYNIFKQMFIENDPQAQGRKNVKIICVEHAVSSLDAYGLEFISAVSSSVLKFLNEMFTTLQDLLHDDIGSDLLKDSIILENDMGTLDIHSSLQGEIKFALGKHAMREHGDPLLEQIESAITRIGNVLGLVRVVVAGCFRYSSNIPWHERRSTCNESLLGSFEKLGCVHKIVLSEETISSAAVVNKPQSSDGLKPFSSFIDMFIENLQCSDHQQLKDLFQLLPSVIANTVDTKLGRKDKLLGRDTEASGLGGSYDGFVLGVAFVLKVSRQEKPFDELNWFASTRKKLVRGTSSLSSEDTSKSLEKGKGGSSLLAGLKLNWRRAPPNPTEASKELDKRKRYENEIELIEHSLKFARTVMSSV